MKTVIQGLLCLGIFLSAGPAPVEAEPFASAVRPVIGDAGNLSHWRLTGVAAIGTNAWATFVVGTSEGVDRLYTLREGDSVHTITLTWIDPAAGEAVLREGQSEKRFKLLLSSSPAPGIGRDDARAAEERRLQFVRDHVRAHEHLQEEERARDANEIQNVQQK